MFLIYLIKVALCWTAFYLLYAGLFRSETFFSANRFYLLGSLVLGALLPLVPEKLFFLQEPELVSYTLQPIVVGVDQIGQAAAGSDDGAGGGFGWMQLLSTVYLLGMAVATSRFAWGIWQLYKLRKNAAIEKAAGYTIYHTGKPHLPFSFFRGLYWSRHFQTDEVSRQNILRHEEAHIFQWHSLDVMVAELAAILLWWFPIARLYRKEIKTTHEYLADEHVTRWFSKKEYGRLLLRQSQSGMQVAISNAIFSSQLKRRIIMMTRTKSPRWAQLKYLAALPLMAFLFFSFALSGNEETSVASDAGTTSSDMLEAVADTIPDDNSDPVFKVVETPPTFPGCEDLTDASDRNNCSQKKMMEYVFENVKYPSEAKSKGVEGLVVISFIVEKDGSVSSPKVVRSVDPSLDQEALRVVKNMPLWNPGKQRGKPVRVQYNMPFRFKLDEKDKEALIPAYFPSCAKAQDRKKCSSEVIMKHLIGNLKYPEDAKKEGIQGNVVVKVLIDENGKVEAKEVVKSLNPSCDQAAIDAINSLPKMVPARKGKKTVATEMVLPISFRMSDDEEK
jgi:TonB family protein